MMVQNNLPWRERMNDLIRYDGVFRLRSEVLVELRRAGVPEPAIDRYMSEAEVCGDLYQHHQRHRNEQREVTSTIPTPWRPPALALAAEILAAPLSQ